MRKMNFKPGRSCTMDERINYFSNRLHELTKTSPDYCYDIAKSKLEFKWSKIKELEKRQFEGYSYRRGEIIMDMKKDNPLKWIENIDHAEHIVDAHARHTSTDYDEKLEEGRKLAKMGIIKWSEVREYARSHMNSLNLNKNI